MTNRCHACRAEMESSARFCRSCGAPTRAHAKVVVRRHLGERKANSRAAVAFGLACALTLFGLIAVVLLFDVGELGDWQKACLLSSPVVVAAITAGLVGGEFRRSFPVKVALGWMLAAVPAAALTLAVSVGFVELLYDTEGRRQADLVVALWVAIVILAPLFEEWLCRGVAWNAASTMSSPRTALVLTAVLFAFLHGLQGHMLALPHRFFMGLVLGWLRLKSGSLLPAILCHALHNAAAVYWFGG